MKKILFCLALCFVLSAPCCADTLILKDGRSFDGTFRSRGEGVVTFAAKGMLITVPEADVQELTFGTGGGGSGVQSSVQVQSAPTATGVLTVSAGTVLHIRMQDTIDTRTHIAGHRFTAEMEADVVVNGVVVIPRGATVYGQLADAKQAGHVIGKSGATLVFTGVMLNNQIKPIYTGQIKAVNESGSGASTARKTATGVIIGGLVDGSDGAKTGAAIGLGLSLLTRGDSLNIPSGTLLDVPLAAPFAP